ncbi:hypothetical protein M3Y96_00426200 [Aphelenchoides besseyi]|nr:hypothetical protein M3Y96_00426200 [Aphelenchoides besseyi]
MSTSLNGQSFCCFSFVLRPYALRTEGFREMVEKQTTKRQRTRGPKTKCTDPILAQLKKEVDSNLPKTATCSAIKPPGDLLCDMIQYVNPKVFGDLDKLPNGVPTQSADYRARNYKTVMCRLWLLDGRCKFRGLMMGNPKYKTKPCINFSQYGVCQYGYRCLYIHKSPQEDVTAFQMAQLAVQQIPGSTPVPVPIHVAPVNMMMDTANRQPIYTSAPFYNPMASQQHARTVVPIDPWISVRTSNAAYVDSMSVSESQSRSFGCVASIRPGLNLHTRSVDRRSRGIRCARQFGCEMSVARGLFLGAFLLGCVCVVLGMLVVMVDERWLQTVVFYEKDPISNDLCGVAKVNASGYFKAHVVEKDGGGGKGVWAP